FEHLQHYKTETREFTWSYEKQQFLRIQYRRKQNLKFGNNHTINTESLENLETFFQLRDDTEWRLSKSRRRKIRSITENVSIFDAYHRNLFDCLTIEKFLLPNAQFLAAGWTKAVYRTAADPRTKQEYAVKTVDVTGQDVGQCLEKFAHKNSEAVDMCYTKAAKKIVKEIALLDQMRHPNIIEVFGYCIPKNFHSDPQKRRVMIVTELGEPVNLIKLLQLSWEDRLKHEFFDSSASISIDKGVTFLVDSTSLTSFGASSSTTFKCYSALDLRQQSGLRILNKANLRVEKYANLSACESGHFTVVGRTNISKSSKIHLDASRLLAAGDFVVSNDVTLFLYDSSLLRIYEGGSLNFGPFSIVALYRGASFEVSEWWQHAIQGDLRAIVDVGPGFRASLLDRSSLQTAKGRLHTGPNAVFTLYKQSSLWLKGRLNVSESSSITVGERGRLIVGTQSRLNYDVRTAPSLAFGLPNIQLIIKDGAALIVEPGAHCLLLSSMTINDTTMFTNETTKLPYVACYNNPRYLVEAAQGVQESRTLCVRL
uniref:Protein kinase domain-containing protein n=1 Tax=Romanomermis culicivorax TaxID=13658 RepID=A0A915JUB8_ROMCU